jgi:hypothetical protein
VLGWQKQNVEACPNLPNISLWDFFDGYSYLIAQISASIHNPIGAFPQDNPLPVCIMVILILKKENNRTKNAQLTVEKLPKSPLVV